MSNEIESDPSQGANPEEFIRDLEAKIDQIQSQISRYKTLFAAGSVAVAVAGSALFIFFSIVDERVRGLSTTAEEIASQHEEISTNLSTIKSEVIGFETKISDAEAGLKALAAVANEDLASRIEFALAESAVRIEQKRDEILATQEFESITTQSLRVVDDEGREAASLMANSNGGQFRVFDTESGLMTLRLGNSKQRLGALEMYYAEKSTLSDKALTLNAGDASGQLRLFSNVTRNPVAALSATRGNYGGAWLYGVEGNVGLRLNGGGAHRMGVYDGEQLAAEVGSNRWGGYFSTITKDTGMTSSSMGNSSQTGNGGVWLYDVNGKRRGNITADAESPSIELYGPNNQKHVSLEIGRFGDGGLYLYNRDAEIVAEIETSATGGLFRARSPKTRKTVSVLGGDRTDRAGVLELYTEQGLEHLALQHWNGATYVRAYRVDRGDKAERIFRFGVDKSGRQYYEAGGVETILDAE